MSKIYGKNDIDLDELEGDNDFILAIQLQMQMDADEDEDDDINKKYNEDFKKSQSKVSLYQSPIKHSLNDPEWELVDPNPDIRIMFQEFDKKYFWSSLGSCVIEWSKRMTICAGIFYLKEGGIIRLSEPLLKFRPRKDLVETLLHEMIHAYLYITRNFKDRGEHGDEFKKHMTRINQSASTNITVYHSFHDEVRNCRQHVWRCTGPCKHVPPFYGYVKRSMNRAPSKNDRWWSQHQQSCNGKFEKISEPESFKEKNKSKLNETKLESESKKESMNKPSTKNLNSFFTSQSKIKSPTFSQIKSFENQSSFPDTKLKPEEFFKLGPKNPSPTSKNFFNSPSKTDSKILSTNSNSKSSPDLTKTNEYSKIMTYFKPNSNDTQKTPNSYSKSGNTLTSDKQARSLLSEFNLPKTISTSQTNLNFLIKSSTHKLNSDTMFKLGKNVMSDKPELIGKKRKSDSDEIFDPFKKNTKKVVKDEDLSIVDFIDKKINGKNWSKSNDDVIVLDSKQAKSREISKKDDNDLIGQLFNNYSECPICGQNIHEDVINSHVNSHF